MATSRVFYRSGYRHQLRLPYTIETDICPDQGVFNAFLVLSETGRLVIDAGYAWDGASGAFDTKSILRGSLVHDALYQLIREGLLPGSCKLAADELFIDICKEDGMWAPRRFWVGAAVFFFGHRALRADSGPRTQFAP